MRKLLLILILLSPNILLAQSLWENNNLTWYYSQRTPNPDVITYTTFEIVSDTLIHEKNCKKIIEVERYLSDTIAVYYHYFLYETDSMLFFKENEFHLLYDFSALAGDAIHLNYFKTYNNEPLEIIIDSTDLVVIDDKELKVQYVSGGDGMSIEFGGTIIEGIGNLNYMFPIEEDFHKGPLRCCVNNVDFEFHNPNFSINNWNGQNCDEIIVFNSLTNNFLNKNILIYPSPFDEYINITGVSEHSEYRIINLQGENFKTGIFHRNNETIDLSHLPKGIYILEIIENGQKTVRKIIKQ